MSYRALCSAELHAWCNVLPLPSWNSQSSYLWSWILYMKGHGTHKWWEETGTVSHLWFSATPFTHSVCRAPRFWRKLRKLCTFKLIGWVQVAAPFLLTVRPGMSAKVPLTWTIFHLPRLISSNVSPPRIPTWRYLRKLGIENSGVSFSVPQFNLGFTSTHYAILL